MTAERLSALIQQVRTNPGYRERARYFQTVMARTRGLDVAAGVIERVLVRNQAAAPAGERAASAHA